MSINNVIRIIGRVEQIVTTLEPEYKAQPIALDELKKLKQSLQSLNQYLNNIEDLKPHYNTSDINHYVDAMNLHLAILKEVLTNKDYQRLNGGIKAIKALLHFHPTKYSAITYVFAKIVEFIYFI